MFFEDGVYYNCTSFDGCYLLIDKTKISADRNYLWILNQIEYERMHLNFEIFIDRNILSQGSNFLGVKYLSR